MDLTKTRLQPVTANRPKQLRCNVTYERYFQAVDYLQQRLWHELPIVPVERALQHRVRHVLAHLGDPQLRFPVIHVAGSAGKGSTSAIIASILRAAGLRTGLYTSPHLQTFIERIDVDGALIPPDEFADTVLGLDPLVRRMHLDVLDGAGFGRPSLVEVAFAAGMKHFADRGCDVAVVEAGLGGRTDYSNVFDRKPVAVITNVEYEHRERLGWSLASIAREKAAIIRGGETVVAGVAQREALAIIEERCDESGAELWRLGHEIRARIHGHDSEGLTFSLKTPFFAIDRAYVPLAGAHQVKNAATAIAAAFAFAGDTQEISEQDVRHGLDRVRLSGRLEQVHDAPRVLLDSAHNPAEAHSLARALSDHWLRDGGATKLHLVAGILADKDQPAMVRAFAPVAHRVVLTQPPLSERIGDPERMLALFRKALGVANVVFEPSHERALDLALRAAGERDIVCVAGSMFLVGALRGRWVPEERILRCRTAAR